MVHLHVVSEPPSLDDVGVVHSAIVIEGSPLARLGIGVVLADAGVRVEASVATATQGFAAITAETSLIVIGACSDSTARHAVRRAAAHGVGIVVLLPAAQSGTVLDICADGAHAVVPRDVTPEELAAAVRHAFDGERYVPPRLLAGAFDTGRTMRPAMRPRFNLTSRETAVLAELAAGRSNQEIAERLCIGSETVKTHLGNIYAKLAVRRRHHAVGIAFEHGLV
jgi:DNA-binding NarL/FixJ family response regulator